MKTRRVMTLSLVVQTTAVLDEEDGVTDLELQDLRHSTVGFMTKGDGESGPPSDEYKAAMGTAVNRAALRALLRKWDEAAAEVEQFPQPGANA